MRYLVITSKDAKDDDVPAVHFGFYEHEAGTLPRLIKQALAEDLHDFGELDEVTTDDVIEDGVVDEADKRLIKCFAQQFLEFNWFSPEPPFDKHMKIFAEDFDVCGVAQTVRLEFFKVTDSLAFSAAYQTNADGRGMELTIFSDVNGDKQTNYVDAQLVKGFALQFLSFRWYGAHDHTFCQLQLL
nr:hypothetical protein [uncultured Pseudomonas sp.]